MDMQHVLKAALAAMAALSAGCGTVAPSAHVAVAHARAVAPVAAKAASVRAAAPAVNHQSAALTITAPAAESAGNGAIALHFSLPARSAGYALLATPDDVDKIEVQLQTKVLFISHTLATAEVTRDKILNNNAIVQFTGLNAQDYSVTLTALDVTGAQIGTTSARATVKGAEVTTVNAALTIDRSAPSHSAGSTGGGASLGVNLEISNGQ